MTRPEIRYMNAPCPRCNARDIDEAGDMCRPTTDETGESYCAGQFNKHGMSEVQTPDSIAQLEAWFSEQLHADQ